jgi:hypothetical protein
MVGAHGLRTNSGSIFGTVRDDRGYWRRSRLRGENARAAPGRAYGDVRLGVGAEAAHFELALPASFALSLEGQRRLSLTIQEGRPHARKAALLREWSCLSRLLSRLHGLD